MSVVLSYTYSHAGARFFMRMCLSVIYLKAKSRAGVFCDEGARPWARGIMLSGTTCLLESGEGSCGANGRQNVMVNTVPKE